MIVADAMLRRPTVLPADATVAEVRALLSDDHKHLALLAADDGMLVGTLACGDVPADVPADAPAAGWSSLEGRTVDPAQPLEVAGDQMRRRGVRRLAVVDPRGHLLGLLCLKRHRHGFCSDADVHARVEERGEDADLDDRSP